MNSSERVCDIAKIALISVIASTLVNKILKAKKKRKERRWWVKEWIKRRETLNLGVLPLVHDELRQEDPDAFKNFLRMDHSTFDKLFKLVENKIAKQDTHLRQSIPARDRLSVTLRFLATGETYQSLSFATRIPACTLSGIIPEVCSAIYGVLVDTYLQFPGSPNEWEAVAKGYMTRWQIPQCIGAMDGKHITFRPPKTSGSFYFNYKETHSIVLLAIVDSNYKFVYLDVGTNGRVSDGGVFRDCDFNLILNNEQLNLPPERPLPGMNTDDLVPYVLLADAAFPLQKHILKPYPFRNMTHEQRIFNYRLSRGRRMVENVFGILASRFRILLSPINLSVEKVELVTLTCCALHNFLRSESSDYCGPASVDNENEFGEIQPGEWRQGPTFQHSVSFRYRRPSNHALQIREIYKRFFNTVGTVPWQERAVNLGG